ncbi:MAG: O-acetyl-ADP-ribose deacetylase [Ruminococcus sp.]|nr:O-acetyl-ADP-ribose deacetylase [Ruminococcus sp.]
MIGAILGDMIGAPYEFDRGNKTKEFPLFSKESEFTDDSVMTIAVAEALINTFGQSDDEIKTAVIDSMQKWGKRYPNAGYGGMFGRWLFAKEPKPYGSFGNGSAMRVTSVGWLYDDIETTRKMAALTAEVTHNHPEGIKGAEATASAIFLARTGHSKDEIHQYIVKEFGYDLSHTCDEIRPTYHHVESCQETVPEAITAFLEGTDFEDVIRTAVSLGGDCDTLTCIAGGIAEAFYGVSMALECEAVSRLPKDMEEVLNRFDNVRGKIHEDNNNSLDGNNTIDAAISRFNDDKTKENLIAVLEAIRARIHEDGDLIIPVTLPPEFQSFDVNKIQIGETFSFEDDGTDDGYLHFKMQHLDTADGKTWLAAFTSYEEHDKGDATSTIIESIKSMLKSCRNMSEEGIIINPWGNSFMLSKELINVILDADKPDNHIYFELGDITELKVDAIVNAANNSLLGGGGVDGAIHHAAGPKLLEECRKLNGCETGDAKITAGYDLKAEYVIHTVGPIYKAGDPSCEKLLKSCYYKSLELAKEYDIHTIAFPAISTGAYGYPINEAAVIALSTIATWLSENPDYGMAVIMVCYDQKMLDSYQRVLDDVHHK